MKVGREDRRKKITLNSEWRDISRGVKEKERMWFFLVRECVPTWQLAILAVDS